MAQQPCSDLCFKPTSCKHQPHNSTTVPHPLCLFDATMLQSHATSNTNAKLVYSMVYLSDRGEGGGPQAAPAPYNRGGGLGVRDSRACAYIYIYIYIYARIYLHVLILIYLFTYIPMHIHVRILLLHAYRFEFVFINLLTYLLHIELRSTKCTHRMDAWHGCTSRKIHQGSIWPCQQCPVVRRELPEPLFGLGAFYSC